MKLAALGWLPALLFALPGTAQNAPDERPPKMTLSCKSASAGRYLSLGFTGSVDLPPKTMLYLKAYHLKETFSRGRIFPVSLLSTSTRIRLNTRRFKTSVYVRAPGNYQVFLNVPSETQVAEVTAKLKKTPGRRDWEFRVPGWSDSVIKLLGKRLEELDVLTYEGAAILNRYKSATSSKVIWLANGKKVNREGERFRGKLRAAKAAQLYPAAFSQIIQSFTSAYQRIQYLVWNTDGSPKGTESYYGPEDDGSQTFRDEPFDFDKLKEYVAEASMIAGREFCIWAIHDIRNKNGHVEPALATMLSKYSEHVGISPYVAQLQPPTLEKLDELEESIRGKKLDKAKDELEKNPGKANPKK